VQPRQGQPLDPAHQVVGQHADCQIRPVGVKLPAGEPIQRQPVLGLPDEVLRGGPLQMLGHQLRGRFLPVGDDGVIPVPEGLQQRRLLALRQPLAAQQHPVRPGPAGGPVERLGHPDLRLARQRRPGLFGDSPDGPHQRRGLIGRDGKAHPEPFALGHDGLVVKPRVHGHVDPLGQILHLVDALADEADRPVGRVHVARAKAAVKPIPRLPDKAHQGVQGPDARVGHARPLLVAEHLVEGGVDVHGEAGTLRLGPVDPAEALRQDALELPDMPQVEAPQKIPHRRGVRDLAMAPEARKPRLLPQHEQIVQALAPGDHAHGQPQDGLRLPVAPLAFLDPDVPVDQLGQPQAVNELIEQDAAAETHQGVVAFHQPKLPPAELLHVHLPGERDDGSLTKRKPFVHRLFKELETILPVPYRWIWEVDNSKRFFYHRGSRIADHRSLRLLQGISIHRYRTLSS